MRNGPFVGLGAVIRSVAMMLVWIASMALGAVPANDDPWAPRVRVPQRQEISPASDWPPSGAFAAGGVLLLGDDLIAGSFTAVPKHHPQGGSDMWPGEVHVLRWRDDRGEWTLHQTLFASMPPLDPPVRGFGRSIAGALTPDGAWLFVATPETEPGRSGGAVIAFHRPPGGDWRFAQIITAAASGVTTSLGPALAFDGKWLAIGVPGEATGHPGLLGGAVLYELVDGRLVGPQLLSPPPAPGVNGVFGTALAVADDVVAVAAPNGSSPASVISGVIATFTRHESGAFQFEGYLGSPGATPFGRFGKAVAMSDGQLAVAATQESILNQGQASVGVVYVFRRAGEKHPGWRLRTTLPGPPANPTLPPEVQLQWMSIQLALDGAMLLIGWEHQAGGPPPSAAVLMIIPSRDDAAPEEIVRITDDVEDDVARFSTGSAVAIGGARVAIRQITSFAVTAAPVIRVLTDEALLGDCDRDGKRDAAAVLAGRVADCDGNLVPDACDADCDANLIPDTCDVALMPVTDTSLEPTLGGVHAGWGQQAVMLWARCTVPPHSDGMVRGVVADWSVQYAPFGAIIALYDDPNQDGRPADTRLIAAFGAAVTCAADGFERVRLPPTFVGPPGTRFFVGLGLRQAATGSIATLGGILRLATAGDRRPVVDPEEPPTTWIMRYPFDGLDPAAPLAELAIPLGDVIPFAPDVACAALFASPLDTNVNGVPDACECLGDLDRNGAVAAADLTALLAAWGTAGGSADLDADGVVASADLAALISAWGPCR
jgi:hypothetical protein